MTAFFRCLSTGSRLTWTRPSTFLLERPRRESHCQHGEHASALQTTSSTSFSGDITVSASIGSTDHRLTNTRPGPSRSFYTFPLHDRTIKRFPRIAFPFAGFHFPSSFFAKFDGTFGLILPDSFRALITCFENPDRQARRDTPHLTVGGIPWSFGGSATSGPSAFTSGWHTG